MAKTGRKIIKNVDVIMRMYLKIKSDLCFDLGENEWIDMWENEKECGRGRMDTRSGGRRRQCYNAERNKRKEKRRIRNEEEKEERK